MLVSILLSQNFPIIQEEDIDECIVLVTAEERLKCNASDQSSSEFSGGKDSNKLSDDNSSSLKICDSS